MNEHMREIAKHKVANQIPLAIKTYVSAGDRTAYASETSNRLVQAACQLPSGECLGFQFNVDHAGKPKLTAFSSAGVHVSKEDYGWIFWNCAEVSQESQETDVSLDAFHMEGRRVYALQCDSKRQECEQHPQHGYMREEKTASFQHFTDLLEEIEQTGAEIRILSNASCGGCGMILISLQNEMTLRMRVMLSLAFSITSAIELKAAEEMIDLLPAECLINGLSGLLKVLMYRPTAKSGDQSYLDRWLSRDGTYDEDICDEDICDDNADKAEEDNNQDMPIDDLDFSVRTFNVLRRAGIDTLSKLRGMSTEELMQVRNLGRKSVEEIKNKLQLIEQSEARKEPSAELPTPNYTDMLDKLIGLENVKEQVRRIAAFARMKQDMERKGKDSVPVVLNMVFSGNPGTAKTTVARIIAGLFHEIGLLSSAEVVEVGRADLVAQYVGQTAPQVKSVFQKAKGKLLFIDEAYSLVEVWGGSYGDEAISTIVQEMENNRENTIVVFAGYPDKMEEFFSRNPGMRSRVPFHISFPDYSADEMVHIAQLEAGKRGFSICTDALGKVKALCAVATQYPERGNGRYCRNLVEDAILSYASRVYRNNDESPNADYVLTEEDFPGAELKQSELPTRKIGFAVD